MTRNQSLTELITKVEARTVRTDNRKAKWQDCDFEQVGYGYRVNANIAEAYNGSLDAAKALHEAVLPGWRWAIAEGATGCRAAVQASYGSPEDEGISTCPARAWLLAILHALRAMEH